MITIGLDSGSTTTKAVLFEDGFIKNKFITLTSGDPKAAMNAILEKLNYNSDTTLITTGYGRNLVDADKSVTEISCHAKGALYLDPETRIILDIGGQDCKVIKVNSSGMVEDFIMNDKCAAGTGRFIEVILKTLGENIDDLDEFVKDSVPVKINSMCTVFAESEVVSLIAKGEKKADVTMGILHSIAQRIINQYNRTSPSQNGRLFFSGGVAQSEAVRTVFEEYVKRKIYYDPLSQFAGAIGAAIIGTKKKAN